MLVKKSITTLLALATLTLSSVAWADKHKTDRKSNLLQIGGSLYATSIMDWQSGSFDGSFSFADSGQDYIFNIYQFTVLNDNDTLEFSMDISGKTSTLKLNLFGYDGQDLSSMVASDLVSNHQFSSFDMSGASSDNWWDIKNSFLNQLSLGNDKSFFELALEKGDYLLTISGTPKKSNLDYELSALPTLQNAYVTSSVPEAPSLLMMLGGLGLVGWLTARRRKSSNNL